MRNRYLFAILALAVLAACSPKSDSDAQNGSASNVTLTAAQRQNIRLTTVVQRKFHKMVDTSGVVDFDNDQATSVLAPISGPVTRLLVSPGDHVAKGAALALVASPDFATAIGAYRKAVIAAHTARHLADMDKDLLAHQGVSQREAEQAQSDAVSAESDRDAALQALAALNIDPQTIKNLQEGKPASQSEGVIRSPIAGTVVEKLISPGQLLQAGTTPAFTVADLSRVWVMAQLFDSDLGAIRVGDRAQVITGAGSRPVTGTVDNIAALVNPDTRAIAVRVVVSNPGELLKKQMYVRVVIEARQDSTGLLVPVSAILRDDENLPFVYVAQRDGSFARRGVTLGYRNAGQYDIAAGLKAGERIVSDGGLFVQFLQNQ